MLRLAADENFNNDVLRAVARRSPEIAIIRVQDTHVAGAHDAAVLQWAAEEDCLLLTHDANTVTRYAYERVEAGLPMPGVIEVSRGTPIRAVVDDLLLLAACSADGEWEGQILYLPLR